MSGTTDPLDILGALASRARDERVPQVDVSGSVLRRLGAATSLRARTPLRPLAIVAAAVLAAAGIAAVFGVSLYDALGDPVLFLTAVP